MKSLLSLTSLVSFGLGQEIGGSYFVMAFRRFKFVVQALRGPWLGNLWSTGESKDESN